MMKTLKSSAAAVAILAQLAAQTNSAAAFCGFYVAKADSKLFNKSSKVVLTRDGETTAITMASDYEGEPKEFAIVIPVPTFIERKQIGVVEGKTLDHLDAYSAPRLVEYHDADPCAPIVMYRAVPAPASAARGGLEDGKVYNGEVPIPGGGQVAITTTLVPQRRDVPPAPQYGRDDGHRDDRPNDAVGENFHRAGR